MYIEAARASCQENLETAFRLPGKAQFLSQPRVEHGPLERKRALICLRRCDAPPLPPAQQITGDLVRALPGQAGSFRGPFGEDREIVGKHTRIIRKKGKRRGIDGGRNVSSGSREKFRMADAIPVAFERTEALGEF